MYLVGNRHSLKYHMLDFYYGLPGMTQLMRKSPIALMLILRGSRADGLTSPPKDAKENLYSISEVGLSAPRREINLCC